MKKKDVNSFIPLSIPTIDESEIQEVVDTLKSGWITTGPKVQKFEKKFAEHVGSKYALAVSSGTAALHLAYIAGGICRGDEVITTPMTFVATINMIEVLGAKPVFVDIEKETMNIDPSKIEKKITSRTRAIVPVHFAGLPCDMDEILNIANKYNLLVVEDAAHAIGSEYLGKRIGSIGNITCFSFHPIKNITTGEGGMITTNNEEYVSKIKLLRFHGISKEASSRYSAQGLPFYDVSSLGYKYNMMDIQASIGLHQLDKLDSFIKRRTELARSYNELLKDIEEVAIPKIDYDNVGHSWHLYIVKFLIEKMKIDRNQIIVELKNRNIGTGLHFVAVHLQPYYLNRYSLRGTLPNAEYISDRIISLPLYPKMSEEDVSRVVEAIRDTVVKFSK